MSDPSPAVSAGPPSAFSLNIRRHMSVFSIPSYEELVVKIASRFPSDNIVLEALRRHREGEFVVRCQRHYATPPDPLRLDRADRFSGEIAHIEVPFLPFVPQQGRRSDDEVLVTIQRSALTPEQLEWPNTLFDIAFEEKGIVLQRGVQFQTHRGTSVFNGNRFAIVSADDVPKLTAVMDNKLFVKLPTGAVVDYVLSYKGKTYTCRRCLQKHAGECESMQAFYKWREERKKIKIRSAIVSDSTLRQVDQVGLSADVYCSGGAYLSELITTAADITPPPESLAILGGINDVLDTRRVFEEAKDFAFSVSSAVCKLRELKDRKGIKKVSLLLPPRGKVDETVLHSDRYMELEYLLGSLFDDDPNIVVRSCKDVETLDGIHPSEPGLGTLLHAMDTEDFDSTLILRREYMLGKQYYAGCHAANAYGCRTCFSYDCLDRFSICAECKERHARFNAPVIPGRGPDVSFPPLSAAKEPPAPDAEGGAGACIASPFMYYDGDPPSDDRMGASPPPTEPLWWSGAPPPPIVDVSDDPAASVPLESPGVKRGSGRSSSPGAARSDTPSQASPPNKRGSGPHRPGGFSSRGGKTKKDIVKKNIAAAGQPAAASSRKNNVTKT